MARSVSDKKKPKGKIPEKAQMQAPAGTEKVQF
jgi:hypothetical protein